MKRFLTGLGVLSLAGCQHITAPQQSPQASTTSQTVNTPVAVFSTYLSEDASTRCLTLNKHTCADDVISASQFVRAMQNLAFLPNLDASGVQTDYEILIGNQAAQTSNASWWQKGLSTLSAGAFSEPVEQHYFTEVTLQWRGVELDSKLFVTRASDASDTARQAQANAIALQWQQHAMEADLFSASFLFSAMQASDYLNQMHVPESIEDFTLSDTQLYHDPFKGAISRYVHPDYEDALIDISVFPITSPLTAGDDALLQSVLVADLEDARIIADARELSLSMDAPVSPVHFTSGGVTYNGYMMAISATSPEQESLFASTYVFRQHDKIIKLSTTFPPRVSDALIAAAMPVIQVPAESTLMATLRELQASQQSSVN